MPPFWSSSKSHQHPINSSLLYALFLPQTLSLSNKILIFLHSIFCCIHRLLPFFRENFLWQRDSKHSFLQKFVDNNNNYLTSTLLQTFFWKNMLMKVTPILDQAMLSFPQNVGESFNIHSKILKKPFPICFQLGKKEVIFTILSS